MKKYICGKNSVLEAIENKLPIIKIYSSKIREIKIKHNYQLIEVDNNFLNKLTKENHQGFVAEIKNIDFDDPEIIFKDKPQKILILDHIQDPHNFGAIIRTANAFNIKHIVIPKDRSVDLNATVLKVSSGGFVNMKFIKVASISAFITKLKNHSFWVYGSLLNDKAKEINDMHFNYPLAVVLGSESKGISKSVENLCDENFYIKMQGTVQSLNVSVAAGIILFKI
ncbi:23S rRNA (guanosine(2251)-2'-O)-methyltransferase RlmB [Mesomycoplasma lagogenitalium]|uniref:23S rRNA (Guanosine(2251)-2'-O)-methyltransferase RlmB n=1 Tax=Mesomycoplasma lagogenitalium TaxID=171286 RepID=A0ABY8LUG4_9BACT|nr:23S rRNA (guanosine(2251)-2'-O)-methyltransferase RlmB [Mesomycoplasma lagogenitalium]WGI36869.1 23S rRNA (guanosine(2251)-2'-O)-methyltransferase RlmB [Mesomycoplasma lagogenitalium]